MSAIIDYKAGNTRGLWRFLYQYLQRFGLAQCWRISRVWCTNLFDGGQSRCCHLNGNRDRQHSLVALAD
ncbi:hypothetical protein [Pseudoalteromonas sp. G4]|uniref:hypothetical protein n=1 Tax=Pseudoalteromonas sp. G4 TaxID=2992761 RepID=UPI00237E2580|nr:hypothetical protein [Pseudoalteromonas sp. G4]MDE3270429.1 hypothetical protein [Pseudoalteromonas sp. G4]